MEDIAIVQCPYCFESVEVCFEIDVSGRFVQDCEVCCNPWNVTLSRDGGEMSVHIERAQ